MERSQTSVTLLNRIREDRNDEMAWHEFVERYGTRIYAWCIKRRLKADEAEDVSQEVLLKLARNFENFEYDSSQSFRGWLRRITENAIVDFFRARKNQNAAKGGSSIVALISEEPARIELADYLAEAFDLELLDEAKSRVQGRINQKRWVSWDLLSNHGMSGKEVSEKLGISVGVAYANRNQVQKMIKQEIESLEQVGE